MITLVDVRHGRLLGTVDETDLAFFAQHLTQESDEDQDFYIDANALRHLASKHPDGAEAPCLQVLRRVAAPGGEVLWTRDEVRHLLKLTLVSARNLVVRDLLKSDPYCVLTCLGPSGEVRHHYRTAIIKNDLNPRWNVRYNFIVGALDVIKIAVFDRDLLTADDSMGTLALHVKDIPVEHTQDTWHALGGVDHGELKLVLTLKALQKASSSTAPQSPS